MSMTEGHTYKMDICPFTSFTNVQRTLEYRFYTFLYVSFLGPTT